MLDPVAAILGRFITETPWAAIPEAVRHQGRRSLLNFFATAIGSARHADIVAATTVLRACAGSGEATVIGTPERNGRHECRFPQCRQRQPL